MTILSLKILFRVNFMLSKGLQNDTNPQHKFLHMGSIPPPFPQCVKKHPIWQRTASLKDLRILCVSNSGFQDIRFLLLMWDYSRFQEVAQNHALYFSLFVMLTLLLSLNDQEIW